MQKINVAIKNMGFDDKKTSLLKKEYIKALKDDYFQKVISSIDMPEETLMKYTSKLEEYSNELKNCEHCSNLLECKNKVEGFLYVASKGENNIIFSYEACKYKRKLLEETAYYNNVYLIDIPKEIKSASMKAIYKDDTARIEVIKWLKEFIDDYNKNKKIRGLYLSGNFGCGKTYLIAALFNELAKKGVRSAIIYWPEYLRDLKSSFNEGFGEKLEYIQKISLLLIDDIGAENTTTWCRDEILGPILQYRMQEQLPTFFTSNLTMDDLEKHFSICNGNVDVVKARRIIERIKQLSIYKQMISKNRRN